MGGGRETADKLFALGLKTVQALECIKSWTIQKIGNEGVEHVK